ncbi:hypothetical protein ABPG72_010465 [Tetrahymena utriculariae]
MRLIFKETLNYFFYQSARQNTQLINVTAQQTELIINKIKKYRDFNDRFGVLNMQSKEKLLDLFNSRRQKLTLNEQIKIMLRISELDKGKSYKNIYGIDSVIQQIQQRLQKLDFEEDIYLGCLTESLQNLGYYQNQEIWILLCDSILHDRFEIQGTQVYKILKGVSFIKSQVNEEYKIELMKRTLIKLRDIMSIVILDQQYKYKLNQLDEIADIYLKENMLNEQFIKLIDFGFYKIINIMKDQTSLSDQDLSHIININFIFSINSYYSQRVNIFLQNQGFQKLFDQNLIKMMAIAIFLKSQNQLSLNLDNLIENKLQNYDFNPLSLSDLNILLQSLNQLNIQNTQQILETVDQLILDCSYDQNQLFTLGDLKNTQMIRQYKEDKLNKFTTIVSQSYIQVDDVIDFLEYINQQNIEHLFKELYNVLPQFLAKNCNYYNWEQQCLLYYFMRKDQHLMDDFHYQNGFLNVLKEYIKLYYAQRSSTQKYVQPLPLSSNFYKILTVIDLAELFSDSHYS